MMYPPGETISNLEQLDELIDWLYHNPDAPGPVPSLSPEMKQLYSLWARGQALEHKGQFQAAIELYKRALQYAPAFVNGRFSWARSLQALGRYREALSQLQVITTFFSPHDSSVYVQMALIYRDLGDRHGEIDSYKKALEIEPNNLYSWLNLGLAYRQNGELEASSLAFAQALSRLDGMIHAGKPHQYDPEEDKVCFEAARTEFARGAFEQAEPLFLRVLAVRGQSLELWGDPQHNPTVFYTMLFMARIYMRQGKWAQALEQLELCLAFAPSDPTVSLLSGNARGQGSDPLPLAWIWEEM
jgi:tetratricopeptide (TPR) repeat protein